MEFELLGPLRVVEDGRDVTPARPKQRALLAMLLLHREEVVSGARLIEALWGEEPPETAQTALHGHVSALRKLLGSDRIRTRPSGYLLQVSAGEVDVARFESLVARARERDDAGERSACLREALALWRGEPLAELQYEAFAEREIARLEQLRLAAVEDRVDADLALGRHHELVPELEPLVAEHPFRERLRGQLMLALYRCGRQADALHVFQSGRRALVEELGIDPGPALQQLELGILRQDPGLGLPAGGAYPAAQSAPAVRVPVRRQPPVRYASSGDLSIAYQVTGDGPLDVVLISGWVSHLEKDWEEPRHARFLERLGSIARLIRFDKRGTGLSDRPPGARDLEARMDDVRAVMDAADSERAVLFGYSEGAPMAILFAGTYPDRARALVLYGAYAKRLDPDDDYPWAPTRDARGAYAEQLQSDWGIESDMKIMCPSADEAMARWWGERSRAAASPGAIKALVEMNSLIDVRALLPTIHVRTLVVHRGTDFDVKVEEGRYIAEHIPGARFVELPGADHFVGIDPDQILDAVEPFLAECGASRLPAHDDRALATLLVTDIVGSTHTAAELDDRAWLNLVERHHEVVRNELTRFRGHEVDASGDGTLATFDGPARAVRCATAIVRALRPLGLSIRAGVHTGEVEVDGDRVRGVAVHIAARVAGEAAPGEVLVSQTVNDIVAGSGLEFADRGSRALAGVPGEWRLLAVVDPAPIGPFPLIGRDEELERLEHALRRAQSGVGSAVLVAGEAGMGKTRLASELATRARAAGFEVLLGRCLDLVGTELPYQPFVEALRPLRDGQTEHASAGSQLRVFEDTLALITDLAASAPALLVLEDLHWADTSTLDLVVYIAHNLDERRVLLLATYRADEPSSAERVRRLADGVRRSGAALLVELGPLTREELTELLAARAGAPPPALADAIVTRSEGNPFFAEELLAARGDEGVELPRGLRELLLQRVALLDRRTREVLRLAAAAGRDVAYPLLRDAAALPASEVRDSLRRAVEHGILVADRATGSFRFRHALLAEAIYATLLPGEREELHARLADELARGEPHAAAAELAPHWAAAGRAREALVASVEAAREAEAVFGLAEARAHLERALGLWADVPDAAELVGLDLPELSSWAAERAIQTGAAPRAVELGGQAVALVGDGDPLRAALLHERLGRYLLAASSRDAGLAAFERAVELVPPQPPSPERAQVLAALGHALMLAWRHEESRPTCEQALELARAVGARRAEFRALAVLGVDLAYLGRGDEGLAQLRLALELAEESGVPEDLDRAYIFLTDVLTMLGRPRESAQLAAAAVDITGRYGIEQVTLVSNQVEALVAIGEWDDADRVSAAALRANTANWPHQALVNRAELEVGRGDFDEARAHLEAALATAREDERGSLPYDPVVTELALWEHRWTDADQAVGDALARTRSREAALFRVGLCAQGLRAQAELAALAHARRDADAIRHRRGQARKLVAGARRAAAEAATVTPNAAGWRGQAEAEYERARGLARPEAWSAAATMWERLERPPRAAYCRWRQAEALVAAGASRTEATIPLREAHAVAARIGARPLLRELELLAERARLNLAPPDAEQRHAK